MELRNIVLETFEMMGFTFIVGVGVAYIILLLTKIFSFFDTGSISVVVSNYKNKIAQERVQWANIKKIISQVEQNSEVESIRYFYENKNKYDTKEIVDDLYHLSKFYDGINKENNKNIKK